MRHASRPPAGSTSPPARRPLVAAAVALAVLSAAGALSPPAAWAQPAPPACGAELTTDTTLTADLDCRGHAGPVLHLRAPGITLDLGGHAVRGDQPCVRGLFTCGIIVWVQASGARVVNGTLDGVGVGADAPDTLLQRLVVSGAETWLHGPGVVLADSFVDRGTVQIATGPSSVRRNLVVGGRGIRLFDADARLQDFEVVDNIVVNSEADGFSARSTVLIAHDVSGVVARNVLARNRGSGIDIGGLVQSMDALAVTDNVVIENGLDGVHVEGTMQAPRQFAGGPVTITGTLAIRNRIRAVDARWIDAEGPGIVDGGRNTALASRAFPACIGVAC